MKATLDGTSIQVEPPTLAAAIAAGAKAAESQGRIIVEVKADGVSLPSEALSNPSVAPGACQDVVMISADPRALVRVSLLDGVEALASLKPLHGAVADALAAGNLQLALDQLREVLNTWQALQNLLEHSRALLAVDLSTVPLPEGEPSFDERAAQFVTFTRAIRDAVSNQDWSALSDTVGYDLDAAADAWAILLRSLANHVQQMPPRRLA